MIVLGLVPWTVPDGAWRRDALDRLAMTLDARSLRVDAMQFSALPFPRLELTDVAFEQHGGGLKAVVPSASIDLSIGALLRGRAKPVGLALAGPTVQLLQPPQDETPFRSLNQILARVGTAFSASKPLNGLRQVAVEQGQISVRSPAGGEVVRIDNTRIRLAINSTYDRLTLTFAGQRQGEEITLDVSGATPRNAQSAPAPLSFSYSAAGLSVDFSGRGSLAQRAEINGWLKARSHAARSNPFNSLLAPLGIDVTPAFEAAGQIDASDRGINFTDLAVTAAGSRFDGVGALRHDGQRWHLTGTLAANRADWSGLIAPLSRVRTVDGAWNAQKIDTNALFASNLDLRISTDRLVLNDQQLGKVALAITTRPGRAEASIADAVYENGRGRLRLVATPGREGVDLKASGSLDNTDLGQVVAQFTRVRRFRGLGNASLALETSGQSIAEFVANADGRLSAVIRDGEVLGIDLQRLANRRAARPERLLMDALGGATAFDIATLNARIARGSAEPVEGRLQSGNLIGSLGGSVDFARGVSDLGGSVVRVPMETFVTEPQPLVDFTITGPLSEPRIAPDIASLLKRS